MTKTITIDFVEYRKELQDAKREGFELLPQLKERVKTLYSLSSNYASQDDWERARKLMLEIIIELDRTNLDTSPKIFIKME